jgi:uncharacterized protein
MATVIDAAANPAQETCAPPELELGGVRVRLLAERAIDWPQGRTVFVADVHLGKAESFRAAGVPVPQGPTRATLERLDRVVRASNAQRLVVLGDLFHARQSLQPEALEPLRRWRASHRQLSVMLVRGNHDASAGEPPADLDLEVVEEATRLGPFVLRHEPAMPSAADSGGAGGYALAGHLHPTVRVGGRASQSLRLRCFWFGAGAGVLPAFGDFTGGHPIRRDDGDRVYAIAGDRVMRVPAA